MYHYLVWFLSTYFWFFLFFLYCSDILVIVSSVFSIRLSLHKSWLLGILLFSRCFFFATADRSLCFIILVLLNQQRPFARILIVSLLRQTKVAKLKFRDKKLIVLCNIWQYDAVRGRGFYVVMNTCWKITYKVSKLI